VFVALADAAVVAHVTFVAFVLLGGVVVWRWRWLAFLHVPAVLWGILVEYGGWICPLTPLEDDFRRRAGLEQYSGDFIAHYVFPLLYPADLTRRVQLVFGTVALLVNVAIYWRIARISRSAHV
jgi:Protein of Unknown function (DUF2784)